MNRQVLSKSRAPAVLYEVMSQSDRLSGGSHRPRSGAGRRVRRGSRPAACGYVRVGPTEVSSSEKPYAPNALDPSDHEPGVLLVTYYSKEAMWAAPQENVRETSPVYYPNPSYTQTLYFEDIANIADPCERFAAEEAKRQETLTWPGYFVIETTRRSHRSKA
jgi:hypothetical protein